MAQEKDMTNGEKKVKNSEKKVKNLKEKVVEGPELRLVGVNKFYKLSNKENFQALYDVNAEFFKGELVSIVGESGSGKSTLMNLIGGLDSDFSGDIISGGQNLRALSDKELDKYRKNHVGFVFQSFNLISHLSILDNVTLSLTLSNVAEKEKVDRATKILERVGLKEHLKKKPTQLSGGQKQRVAIARALINDPEIIIADEPTGALDSQTSMQILEILKEIADNGKLVIMVTHSEKVASVSSRVVEIADGRIVGDHKNEKYEKNTNVTPINQVEKDENSAEDAKKKRKNFRAYKNNQNLSFRSAIRLSMHNMWASKTKNFLMALGVAIGIGSLILMMCFSTGITDFIDDTMKSYSDPTIVTITKSAQDASGFGSFGYSGYTDQDLDNLLGGYVETVKEEDGSQKEIEHEGLNNYLSRLYDEGKLDVNFQIKKEDLQPGLQIITMMAKMMGVKAARVVYDTLGEERTDFSKPDNFYTEDNLMIENDFAFDDILYVYTIPPFYSDANILEGEMSTSEGGVMFSKGILDLFPEKKLKNEDGSAREVDLYLDITFLDMQNHNLKPMVFEKEKFDLSVTGVMDTSVMSDLLVMYVDYDFFQSIYKQVAEEQGLSNTLAPNVYYIKTKTDGIAQKQAEKITEAINDYLKTFEKGKFSGSVEEQLAGMFNNMTSVIGTSLIVISCISLLVSAMMILVVLYMSVTERTKEIGVLKSIGARRKDIKRIFTSESFLVGLLSGVVGILFNLLLTFVVWMILINTIGLAPISYRWYYFVIAIGVAVLISMLSGLYPASKAAKLDPVESLRRE